MSISMASGIPKKAVLPTCEDCGKTANRFRWRDDASEGQKSGVVQGGSVWLCAGCEYIREFPHAPKIKGSPHTLKALPLQSERLFDV